MSIKISQNFDAGAIEVVSALDVENIQLNLRQDSNAEFMQWFYFRLQGARDQDACIRILNAGAATYPDGWENYRAVASYDRENWFRVETEFDGKVMTIKHTPETDSVYYAYFEPYSWERHLALLGSVAQSEQVRVEDLGNTVDGRDLNVVVVGNPSAEKKVWIIARQHPGETMAEWLVEGTLNALLDLANPIARAILDKAVLYIVPNMNPDGSVRGNLRTNAAGANLNREWMAPSIETSPEVYYVKKKIEEVGCDLFLDIHGDEGLPYVFVAGSEMLEGFSEKQKQEQDAFVQSFCAASPDFQTQFGYEASKYNEDLLKLASKYVGHTFKCVSLTLELPFKDNANMPDLEVGWDGARSMKLGEAMLQPILTALKN
ncbi:M14 family metallopeptidase [Undibacterium macrobrachii]|uniref:Peptidase n=1 Tax=Undibacterium macrobrachii TaxID=1119058 RepID=A0ABQ2X627_9BURK|nr:M14-type cytosolic carboxypeptidase [Undibacterium macrobrachii]GGX01213.1 peptidase [Undibacterium macrobrachii]